MSHSPSKNRPSDATFRTMRFNLIPRDFELIAAAIRA